MKKVDFLFVYEVRNRELENIVLLGSELARRGFSVAYLNSWECLNLKYPSYDAQVLVVSACYNTGTYRFFTGHAYRFKNVVNLQWEQVLKNGYGYSQEMTSWDFSGDGLVTRHICWGENTKNRLISRFGIKEEFLRVCGYISLDFYRPEFSEFIIDKKTLFAQNELDPNKTTALFISSFALVGMPEDLSGVCNAQLKTLDVQTSIVGQKEFIKWFKQALPKYPDVQFVYRFHPSEADNKELLQLQKEIPNFYCISQGAIKHWIKACDKIYNWISTSAIEAYIAQKQTFVLRPLEVPNGCDLPPFENCEKITACEDFEKTLAVDITQISQPLDEDILKDCYFIGETPAYKNICDWLQETLESKTYKSHQYTKNNTQLYRFMQRCYLEFWYSGLNKFFIKFAKNTKWDISFLNCRRNIPMPKKSDLMQNSDYASSRTKINKSSQGEIQILADKYKAILSKYESEKQVI